MKKHYILCLFLIIITLLLGGRALAESISDSVSKKGYSRSLPGKNGFEYINSDFIVKVYASQQTPIFKDVSSITIEASKRNDKSDFIGTPLENVDAMISYGCHCGGFFGGSTLTFDKGTIQNGRLILYGSFREKTTDIEVTLKSDIFDKYNSDKDGLLTMRGKLYSNSVTPFNIIKFFLFVLVIAFSILFIVHRRKKKKNEFSLTEAIPDSTNYIQNNKPTANSDTNQNTQSKK